MQFVSVCPKILANIIPSIQVIPEQHTAYHTLTISHTGDKLKLGRQIAWKLVALWKHISSLVVFYGQVLVAFLRTSLVVIVWCGVVWCGVVWCGVVWCGVV